MRKKVIKRTYYRYCISMKKLTPKTQLYTIESKAPSWINRKSPSEKHKSFFSEYKTDKFCFRNFNNGEGLTLVKGHREKIVFGFYAFSGATRLNFVKEKKKCEPLIYEKGDEKGEGKHLLELFHSLLSSFSSHYIFSTILLNDLFNLTWDEFM